MFKIEAKNWTVQGNLLVSFFPPGPIDADLWQDYCDTIASEQVLRVMATSIGAVEVDSRQRKLVNEALKTAPQVSVAVVTDEAIVRGLMTATAWLGRVDVKAFPWHKVAEAYRHLSPTGIDEKEALDLVDAIRRRVEARE
ncbi:MAG: STAS/SEC14 domain-containing protein [Enhygromyxa sp.]